MTNEIAVANQQNVPAVDMAVVTEYLDSTGLTTSLLPKEKAMFVQMCKGYGLNPFKREIYCTAYGEGPLLWQLAYSELYFTECLWPDFTPEELYKAILDYQNRERRFL